MAERYATQRSSKEHRRRSLPRLSDSATALHEREFDEEELDSAADGAVVTEGVHERAHAPVRRMPRSSMPRGGSSARGAESAIARVDYGYVRRDLRRIAITGVAMLVLLIVLNVILQSII